MTWPSVLVIIIGLLLPAALVGFEQAVTLHKEWLKAMMLHNTSPMNAQDTIQALIYHVGLKYLFPDAKKILVIISLSLSALFLLWFVLRNMKLEGRDQSKIKLNYSIEFLLIVGLIPNLVHTDSEHFLLALPMLAFVLNYLFEESSKNKFMVGFVILGFLLYGGNWGDLLGEYSSEIAKSGLLGIGNLIIVGTSALWYRSITTRMRTQSQKD